MNDEPVSIVDYDPSWPAAFEREARLLDPLLRPWLAGRIEHVGSTAVPGLASKPVIDIMAPVESLDAARGAIPEVAALDYCYAPYRSDVMHWFCKPGPSMRTHHLHLVPVNGRLWNERIFFRDTLRLDGRLRREYAELKRTLATANRLDREAYTRGKNPFIERVLRART